MTLLVCGTAANAGTPGATQSLGKSRGLQYFKAGFANVVTQVAQPANCDGDAEVTGGGGAAASGPGIRVIASTPSLPPSTTGWLSSAFNPTIDDTLFDYYAICGGDYEFRYRRSDPVRVRAGESGKAVATCNKKEAVLGGGFEARRGEVVGYRAYPSVTKPWDSKDRKKVPDDGWLVKASNPIETFRVDLVAIAVCKRPA